MLCHLYFVTFRYGDVVFVVGFDVFVFGGGSELLVLLLWLTVVCFLFGIWFMIACCTIGLLLGYRLAA